MKKWYELGKQSEYEILSVSSSVNEPLHGEGMLNEGKYWYRYWRGVLPVEIVLGFDRVYDFKGINFFGLSGGSPADRQAFIT